MYLRDSCLVVELCSAGWGRKPGRDCIDGVLEAAAHPLRAGPLGHRDRVLHGCARPPLSCTCVSPAREKASTPTCFLSFCHPRSRDTCLGAMYDGFSLSPSLSLVQSQSPEELRYVFSKWRSWFSWCFCTVHRGKPLVSQRC